jgi:hypothetical protein
MDPVTMEGQEGKPLDLGNTLAKVGRCARAGPGSQPLPVAPDGAPGRSCRLLPALPLPGLLGRCRCCAAATWPSACCRPAGPRHGGARRAGAPARRALSPGGAAAAAAQASARQRLVQHRLPGGAGSVPPEPGAWQPPPWQPPRSPARPGCTPQVRLPASRPQPACRPPVFSCPLLPPAAPCCPLPHTPIAPLLKPSPPHRPAGAAAQERPHAHGAGPDLAWRPGDRVRGRARGADGGAAQGADAPVPGQVRDQAHRPRCVWGCHGPSWLRCSMDCGSGSAGWDGWVPGAGAGEPAQGVRLPQLLQPLTTHSPPAAACLLCLPGAPQPG